MSNENQHILPVDGEARYFPQLFSLEESAHYLKALQEEIEWRHETIQIFGKSVLQPRLTAWYGDLNRSYSYSGRTMHPKPWTSTLLAIKKKLATVSSAPFTSVLINFYRDGRDSMGWHQDNEKELGPEPVIGSVSFGEPRTFQFRHKIKKNLRVALVLANGSYLEMGGRSQECWQHALPKRARVTAPRLNLTFRVLVHSAAESHSRRHR